MSIQHNLGDSPYKMTISRLTVDKLGVKLYDRVSAVLAELVANSYDADATTVTILAPMGELLATRSAGQIFDKGYTISVKDNGCGMTPDQVNDFYLVVGAERRKDARRGDRSPQYGRKVMGRKGVGKLAPFGICNQIELLTSGGQLIDGIDNTGNPSRGYLTAHLVLQRSAILSDTDQDYLPKVGELDGRVMPTRGTTLTLTDFEHRHVPAIDDLARQMAQRFGVQQNDWKVDLVNNILTDSDGDYRRTIGTFDVVHMPNTLLRLTGDRVIAPDGQDLEGLKSGFEFEGQFYGVTGWIGYAKDPYKDDLMAGVRVYCRGKIAAQTAIFGRRAGFTGEHNVRSYLIGEIQADWLDDEEDLIQTDRRDILWSHPLGSSFEAWGQALILQVGQVARKPMKSSVWAEFKSTTDLESRVAGRFPLPDQATIRHDTLELAKLMVENARGDEMRDPEVQESIVNLTLLLGPHLTLDRTMIQATTEGSSLSVLTSVLKVARVAELSSFGKIARNRVEVISLIEEKRSSGETDESVYQNLITQAPWLIDPQWSPITSNRRFSSLKAALEQHLSQALGHQVNLGVFSLPLKRVDFVLHNHDENLELIEIKPPGHAFTNADFERFERYYRLMRDFLADSANNEYQRTFPTFKLTLVCDQVAVTDSYDTTFELMKRNRIVDHISWAVFLGRTKQMHSQFLDEADRQRLLSEPGTR